MLHRLGILATVAVAVSAQNVVDERFLDEVEVREKYNNFKVKFFNFGFKIFMRIALHSK